MPIYTRRKGLLCPCPYCGEDITDDPWDYAEGTVDTECGGCGGRVTVCVSVCIDYVVLKREEMAS